MFRPIKFPLEICKLILLGKNMMFFHLVKHAQKNPNLSLLFPYQATAWQQKLAADLSQLSLHH
jgi:hypothetical protein